MFSLDLMEALFVCVLLSLDLMEALFVCVLLISICYIASNKQTPRQA